MYYIRIILVYLVSNATFLLSFSLPTEPDQTNNDVLLKEVLQGGTVDLACRSNDKNHIFDYWIVHNKGLVIGPSNTNYDIGKYKYAVLSGNLTIRQVSDDEEGLYSCVSRQVTGGDNINIEMVKVHVLKNWEDIYEHNSEINTIRIIIVLITLVLVSIGGYVLYSIWRDRFRYPSYLTQNDEDDDDSTEEIFQAPSTSSIKRSPSPSRIILKKSEPFEDLSTDFRSILDTANGK